MFGCASRYCCRLFACARSLPQPQISPSHEKWRMYAVRNGISPALGCWGRGKERTIGAAIPVILRFVMRFQTVTRSSGRVFLAGAAFPAGRGVGFAAEPSSSARGGPPIVKLTRRGDGPADAAFADSALTFAGTSKGATGPLSSAPPAYLASGRRRCAGTHSLHLRFAAGLFAWFLE
jgi:hypothetical protein